MSMPMRIMNYVYHKYTCLSNMMISALTSPFNIVTNL